MMLNLCVQLAPFVLITLILCVALPAFFFLKKEITPLSKCIQEQHAAIDSMASQIEDLKRGLREAEERAGVLVPPMPPKSGLNLNRRTQVLRMSRLGEKPANIATALNLPRKEVELLIKVQKIVLSTADIVTTS
jgi:hypothetical protein